MQWGCCAWLDIIQVSAQPVTPSDGTTDATGTLLSSSMYCWFTGHAVPITMSPVSNPSTSSEYTDQYFETSPACTFRSATAAWNCVWFSSYGSVIPRAGECAFRYSAASA